MKSLDKLIDEVHAWAPIAPRASERRIEVLRGFPGLTQGRRRRLDAAATRATTRPVLIGSTCDFPVAGGEGLPAWLEGAVLTAVAVATPSWVPPDCSPLEAVFPSAGDALEQARTNAIRLYIYPSRETLDSARALPDGNSCLGALLLAEAAAFRGVSVPPDIVVSADVTSTAVGRTLAPVQAIEAKLRAVATERPNARIFVCSHDAEQLPPGTPFEALVERLLPPSPSVFAQIAADVATADVLFAQQRYDDAGTEYARILSRLTLLPGSGSPPQAAQWVALCHVRIGAAHLHAGRTAAARTCFERVKSMAPASLLRAEAQLSVVGALIDEFAPAHARRLLRTIEREWSSELKGRIELKTRELRLMRLQVLGARRRIEWLEGDAQAAFNVQRQLLGWAPADQRARALCDLAECQRRLSDLGAARVTLRLAKRAVARVIGDEQVQTRGFLAWVAGLVSLDQRRVHPQALQGLIEKLSPTSAARWRLEMLARLNRVQRGDRTAVLELVESARTEPSPLRRWLKTLGVVRAVWLGDEAAKPLAIELVKESAPLFARHPKLKRAARAFVTEGESLPLLQSSAY